MISDSFPALDCHAHIAPDVTRVQLEALGSATVFAVTRSLAESAAVAERRDDHILWGCGVHPGVADARAAFSQDRFRRMMDDFVLVGEVGLDRRAGSLDDQNRVFVSVLSTIENVPVLVSVHSAGCTANVTELVAGVRHPGIILHWFLGTAAQVRVAAEAGCYFSVNGAMSDDVLSRFPVERMLPETDFPSTTRRGGGRRPGDIDNLERRVAALAGEAIETIRWRWYRNLRSLALASGTLDRLPDALADTLLSA